jgi:plasmid stabilization system protein ParE
MIRIFVSERASADTDRLESWLLEHGASYANELGVRLEAAIGSLVDYPERASRSRNGRYRELYVEFHSNQYVVQYQVRADIVVILRIFHSLEDR